MIHRLYLKKLSAAIVWCLAIPSIAHSQEQQLSIEDCYSLAKKNYPLIKQSELIEKTKEYTLENLSKGNLPQINFNGQASYQSDVTKYPVFIPNVKVPVLSKDQYKIYGEINQPLTDMVVINARKELTVATTETNQQQLEVELYKLKERVNQLFFGALLAEEQLLQNDILKKDIQSGLNRVNASIINGTAFKSNAQMLEAELLKADQQAIELKTSRKSFRDMLGYLVAAKIDEHVTLVTPAAVMSVATINRPEIRLYELQKQQFSVQQKMVDNKKIPKLGLFLQGGYGRPALDFLSNKFDAYYITGIRLNWNLSAFYTLRREKDLLEISRKNIDVQKETFLFNTGITLSQQANEIEKYRQLVNTDHSILLLRQKVKTAASAQLENGVITAIDFISYVNAEDEARRSMSLHSIQLLLAEYNYQNTTGN